MARGQGAGGSVAPWLLELARTAPGLVRSYLPGSPVGARARERVLLAVAEADASPCSAWVHEAWAGFLGDSVEDPADGDDALLDYARACARAGRPLDATPLALHLSPDAVTAVRATVAHLGAAAVVGRRADALVQRLLGRRPVDPAAAVAEAVTVAVALPLAAPLAAAAAAMRVATRLAPPVPEIDADDDANLLVHLLARTVPAYLANAGVRLAALRLPVPVSIGVRTGRSAATVRIGRGRVEVVEGIGPEALLVLEGDVEPLLQVATGSLLRELSGIRLRRE